MGKYSVGIDIGSTAAKMVVMTEGRIEASFVRPTGWSSAETAGELLRSLEAMGVEPDSMSCVATGYGRVSVPYADRSVTEISCHGLGACELFGRDSLTVVDVGGQDTKIISVQDRRVRDFVMNDKCSAGTGRFLEVMANTLGLDVASLCRLAAEGRGVSISSMCTVFAESEVIGLIGRGEKRENIAFAAVDSVVRKVAVQLGRLDAGEGPVCLTGGLCGCEYFCRALAKELGRPVETDKNARFAGAIGAAKLAGKIREE